MMGKRIFLACFIIVALIGCKKVEKLTQFEMDYDETVIVPASTGVDIPIDLLTPDIETNSESTFEINDTRKDLIEEIYLTKLELTLTQPEGADFSFLESISIYIKAEGLSETKVAWKESISSEDTYLKLETSNKDIKEYIKKDEFSLRVNAVTDEFLTTDHHIKVHSVFFVDAKILGQ